MASSKTVVKTIRIKNEVAEYFKDKPLNRYVEEMCECMQRGEIEENGNSISVHTDNTKSTLLSNEMVGQIEHMCSFFKIDAETFLKEVCKGLESGKIGYENGLKTYGTLDTERFEDACHDKGVDPEKMLEKATQMVWKV